MAMTLEREEIHLKNYPINLLQKDWTKRKTLFLKDGADFIQNVHEMEVREDDIWVVTLPKCGTTWMQELVWLVLNNFDFEAAKKEHIDVRGPFLELDYYVHKDLERAFKPIEALKPPRFIKSHLPLPLLPAQLWQKKPKLIYIFRDIKDVAVSEYYHARTLGRFMDKTLDEYVYRYMDSIDEHLSFDHVTEFYALRHEPWIFYTSFELMKKDLRKIINDICQFLNKTITETQMQQMLHHLSFEEMQKNPKTSHSWAFEQLQQMAKEKFGIEKFDDHKFVRKGLVGGYKEELSPEVATEFDKWVSAQLVPFNVTMNELLLLNDEN